MNSDGLTMSVPTRVRRYSSWSSTAGTGRCRPANSFWAPYRSATIASSSSERCTTPASNADHSRSCSTSGNGSSRQGTCSASGCGSAGLPGTVVASAKVTAEAGPGV